MKADAKQLADELESGSRDDDECRVSFTAAEDALVIAALRAYAQPEARRTADRCIEIVLERYREYRDEFGPASDPWEYVLDGLRAYAESLPQPRVAHSKSEYRRVKEQGGDILPPDAALEKE